MYGTIGRFRVKDGKAAEVIMLMREWDEGSAPTTKGATASYLYQLDDNPNELVLVVAFDDKESYFANADNPETDKWFRKVRVLLESDPSWSDGEVVTAWTA